MPLDRFYPSITFSETNDWFRGKPVKIKRQYGSKLLGHLWEKRPPLAGSTKSIFHVKIGTMDFYTT